MFLLKLYLKILVMIKVVMLDFDCISNSIICEDDSIISLADDGGIELRNYDIVIIRFNF